MTSGDALSGTWRLVWTTEKARAAWAGGEGGAEGRHPPSCVLHPHTRQTPGPLQESLFILQNARWFGTRAGEVYQVISMPEGSLQNIITFPPEGAFVVDSSATAAGPQRVEFQFRGATLRTPAGTLPLPPVGKGW